MDLQSTKIIIVMTTVVVVIVTYYNNKIGDDIHVTKNLKMDS